MHEATAHGFTYDEPHWANLGQGSPETGPIPQAPPRIEEVAIRSSHQQYAPVAGNKDLCQAVADFYNAVYRKGKKSKYTRDNVSIASGGRLALTRLASALGNINMGHFIPDYTAYEELLSVFKAFSPIPILLDAENGYRISPGALKKEILGRGLSALLASNPCNPTGHLVEGEELRQWCELARECQCSLMLDGGANHPFQNVAVKLLEPRLAAQETLAIQEHFGRKREFVLRRLRQMGIGVEAEPAGSFYVWANLANLPKPLNNGMSFFREGL